MSKTKPGPNLREILDIELKLRARTFLALSDVPTGRRLEWAVELVIDRLIELLLDAREPGRRSPSQFIDDAISLFVGVAALQHQADASYATWPRSESVSFAGYVGTSALHLIHLYAEDLVLACLECESIVDHERGGISATYDALDSADPQRCGILWEIRPTSEEAHSWWHEWPQKLCDPMILPPRSELPDWKLVSRWRLIEQQFVSEVQRWEVKPPAEPKRPHLNETDQKSADYIRNHPGSGGKQDAKASDITFEHFRSHIVRKLKAHGFANPGDGYYPPAAM